MKDLFTRLSENNKEVLNNLEYKSTKEKMVTILQNETFITKLELGICMELYFLLIPKKPFDVETLYNLFDE